MTINQILKYIKGANFFPVFAPGVTNWTHKMRGKDGRGNPLSFTDQDLDQIRAGIQDLCDQAQLPNKFRKGVKK